MRTAFLVTALALMFSRVAGAQAPLREVQSIPLPGVAKRIDHLAVDVAGQRLFVAALGNGSLEVIDLKAGKRIRSVPGLKEPQGVAYLPDLNRVVVANAGGTVVAFDAGSFERVAVLDNLADADNLRIDGATNQLYVGYGDGALGAIDPKTMKRAGDIKLPGHPESFRLEIPRPRIYVNIPDVKAIVVVDRKQREIVSTVPLPAFLANYPMWLDEAHHRLFVGARKPARLVVLDTESGHPVADVACVGDTDDLFYDSERARVYVIGGEGFVDVFDAKDSGRYQRQARIPVASGARTGLWVPELRRLFVAAPKRDGREAAIHVLEAPPATAAIPAPAAQ
jgi:DNA-binding beta-propeller fold protein YncE